MELQILQFYELRTPSWCVFDHKSSGFDDFAMQFGEQTSNKFYLEPK